MLISQSAFQHPIDTSAVETTNILYTRITINDLRVDYFEETDPVSPETIVGVISGFWGYVGILFGIFFTSPTEANAKISDIPRKLTAKWKARKSKGSKGETEMALNGGSTGVAVTASAASDAKPEPVVVATTSS